MSPNQTGNSAYYMSYAHFWTQVYSVWFKKWEDKQGPVCWEHGFFRHKRREHAILVCEMAGYDVASEGLSTFDTLHDATNAFESTTPAAYAETISLHAANEEHPMHDLFLQRQRIACVDIEAADGLLQIRPTMGNLMGDRYIPSVFSLTHRRPLTRYAAGRISRSKDARPLLRKLPWLPGAPRLIDISTVAFAVVHPVTINRKSTPYLEAHRIMKVATDEALQLSQDIAKEGYAQNLGKAELLPRLHGTGAHTILKEMTSWRDHPTQPTVVTEARHLGPYCHFKFLSHKECLRRICAAKKSAPVSFGLWRTNTSYTAKKSALLAHVVGLPPLGGRDSPLHLLRVEEVRQDYLHVRQKGLLMDAPPRRQPTQTARSSTDPGRTKECVSSGVFPLLRPKRGSGG